MTHEAEPVTCPQCGAKIDPRGFPQHTRACAKRPPYAELLAMRERLGSIEAVASVLELHVTTVAKWFRAGEYKIVHESPSVVTRPRDLIPVAPDIFGTCNGCDFCDHRHECREAVTRGWPVLCEAVRPDDVPLLERDFGWPGPAVVAEAVTA